jgi:hypothetical protein
MSTPNTPNAALLDAVRLILAHGAPTLARAIEDASESSEATAGNVALFAEVAAQLARAGHDRLREEADGALRGFDYGDALRLRLQARALSEYACHIEEAHERSTEAENAAEGVGEDDPEPETAEEFSRLCQDYGV